MPTDYSTPFGMFPKSLATKIITMSGHRWDSQNKDWTIITDEMYGYCLDERTGKMVQQNAWVTARYYNFIYALSVNGNDYERACDYVQQHLIKNGNPVNLQEVLNSGIEEGYGLTYGRIVREAQEKIKNL